MGIDGTELWRDSVAFSNHCHRGISEGVLEPKSSQPLKATEKPRMSM